MSIDNLLSRLDKVKKTGNGNWLACCPAHDDKTPSMAIKEDANGRILIHCFPGCQSIDILEAVGLKFSDLFPEKLSDHIKPLRKPFPAADVLEALSTEALLVHIAADRLSKGEILDSSELARLKLASQRIMAGRDMANG
jgi:hypothetical protein